MKEYYQRREFQLFEVAGVTKLIRRMTENDNTVNLIVPYEELFDVIRAIHLETGHGGALINNLIEEIEDTVRLLINPSEDNENNYVENVETSVEIETPVEAELVIISNQAKEVRRKGPKRKARNEIIEEDTEYEEPFNKIGRFEANAIKISDIEATCSENMEIVADKMLNQHIHKLGEAKIGDTVQVPVPDFDRDPADLVNVLAYITKINTVHMTYQLATKYDLENWEKKIVHNLNFIIVLKVERNPLFIPKYTTVVNDELIKNRTFP
ncbi:hypothetical protein BpHYR1_017718 [Brachionus plicatilis]|uniref:Uncharacterized protein n=1 Tax=Brachionus plicatilis TaxID=10195 RepID=A0A3M7T1A3_BRAPC|nr:hypothetical protein BpHYR1_017718 [Brachionus plicatilis]